MIRNLFKTAWRNIQRAKGLALINVSGLAIGMAGSALIFIWLQNEVSFDLFHANRDKLTRFTDSVQMSMDIPTKSVSYHNRSALIWRKTSPKWRRQLG